MNVLVIDGQGGGLGRQLVAAKMCIRDSHKVSLGYKKAEDNPWEQLKNNYPIGSTFHAPVVSLTKLDVYKRQAVYYKT